MIKKTFFFILFFILTTMSWATHIVGGEIFYKSLGNNDYLITLKLYRDCSNGQAPFDDPITLGVYDTSNNLIQTVSIPFPGSVVLPVSISDPCYIAPTNVCVEEAIYSKTINLPLLAGGYILTYQRCCRNTTILNLLNPGVVGSTYTAKIPDQNIIPINTSPSFKNLPPIFLCSGLPFSFDHSAVDIDGDSLVYNFCDPYDGASALYPVPTPPAPPPYSLVPFVAPYSGSYPMSSLPVMSIDPKTGLITGTPNMVGQWIVGICVREYRNGVLLSENKRDFQFNVTHCNTTTFTVNILGDDSICSTGSTLLVAIGANSYIWLPSIGLNTTTGSSVIANPNTTITYTILGTLGTCTATTSSTIFVNSLPNVNLGNDTLLCLGNSISLNAESIMSSYLWSTGETTQSIIASNTANYWIKITDENGCSNSDSVKISFPNCALVWPGDANNDLVANNYDLLSLGMYYDQTGFVRNSVNNLWVGNNCSDWGVFQKNGMDLKFADCNGDGTINNSDTLAIYLNYGLMHNKKEGVQKTNTTDPDLYFVVTNTLVTAGSDINIELWAGDNNTPVKDIYGLAFDISYNNVLIESSTAKIDISSSFVGTQGTNAIRFAKADELNGKIYGAITRTNHTNISGFGKIATITMKARNNITSSTNLQLAITKYQVIDSSGTSMTFDNPTSIITITPAGINELTGKSAIKIYPNPNNGKFVIEVENTYNFTNVDVEIINLMGNEIYHEKLVTPITELNLSDKSNGIYFIKIYNQSGQIAIKKIFVQ